MNNGQESDRYEERESRPFIHGLKENEKEKTDEFITEILETKMRKQFVNQ